MATIQEAQEQIEQQRRQLQQAQEEQDRAKAEIEKAKKDLLSERFRKQFSGVEGLRERQKIASNIAIAESELKARDEQISQAKSQVQQVEKKVYRDAEDIEAYKKALKLYETGRGELAGSLGKKARKYFDQMIESEGTMDNKVYIAYDEFGQGYSIAPEKAISKGYTAYELAPPTQSSSAYLEMKQLNVPTKTTSASELYEILDKKSTKTSNIPTRELPGNVVTKAPNLKERYIETIDRENIIKGTKNFVIRELTSKAGNIGPVVQGRSRFEGKPLNYAQYEYYEPKNAPQKVESGVGTILYFNPYGLAYGALEATEQIITKKGREEISDIAKELSDKKNQIAIPEKVSKPILYTLAAVSVAGGAGAGIKKAISKLPVTYQSTFVSRSAKTSENLLTSESVIETIKKNAISERKYLSASKGETTFIKNPNPTIPDTYKSNIVGTQREIYDIAPASNLKTSTRLTAYSTKEEGLSKDLFIKSPTGKVKVTQVIAQTTPGPTTTVTTNPQTNRIVNAGLKEGIKEAERLAPTNELDLVANDVVLKTRVNPLKKIKQTYQDQVSNLKTTGLLISTKTKSGINTYLIQPIKAAARVTKEALVSPVGTAQANVITPPLDFANRVLINPIEKGLSKTKEVITLPFSLASRSISETRFGTQVSKLNKALGKYDVEINEFLSKKPIKTIESKPTYLTTAVVIKQRGKENAGVSLIYGESRAVKKVEVDGASSYQFADKNQLKSLGKLETKGDVLEEVENPVEDFVLKKAKKKTTKIDQAAQQAEIRAAELAIQRATEIKDAAQIKALTTTSKSTGATETILTKLAEEVSIKPSQSLYYGTGQYEKTSSISFRPSITGMASGGSEDIKTNSFGSVTPFEFTSQKQPQIQRQLEKIKIASEENQPQKIKFGETFKENERLRPIQIQNLFIKLRQSQSQKQKIKPINNFDDSPPNKPTPNDNPPPIGGGALNWKSYTSKPRTNVASEDIEIVSFKGGKEFKVGTERTVSSAILKAKAYLKSNLRASYVLKKGGSPIMVSDSDIGFGEFRRSKVNPFRIVQEKRTRLKTSGEKREINIFKKKKGGGYF